jgi:hypothetical protein
LFFIYKVFDSKPGVIISEEGIFENTNNFPFGWIKWEDIEDIIEGGALSDGLFFKIIPEKLLSTKYIIINIKKKDSTKLDHFYLQSLLGLIIKKYRMQIIVNPNTLNVSYENLEKLILNAWIDYKKTCDSDVADL